MPMICVRIPENMKKHLGEQAELHGLTVSEYCRNALDVFSGYPEAERQQRLDDMDSSLEALAAIHEVLKSVQDGIRSFDYYEENRGFLDDVLTAIRDRKKGDGG